MKLLLLSMLLLVGCTSTDIYNTPREEMDYVQHTKNEITNFQTVEADLYRGGRLTAKDVRFLSENHKIKTIVSFETYWAANEVRENEVNVAKELGIKFIHIPMQPMGDVQASFVWKAVEAVAHEQRPLYFHCYRGSERTGLVAAGYRMKYEGWSYDRATAEMDKYGFSSLFKGWKKVLLNVPK
jgi:protein tyrosine/serine phosphatase